MSKKIVIFADGTGNAFSTQASNVWRLFQALDQSDPEQIAYYIEGVGTSTIRPLAIFDGATGIGVPSNVRKLYRFLCWAWEPDAEIYMFGFSRGAFTVRTLIAMIESEGLIKPHWMDNDEEKRLSHEEMVFYGEDAYRSYRAKVGKGEGALNFLSPSPTVAVLRLIRDFLVEVLRKLNGFRRYDRSAPEPTPVGNPAFVPKQDYEAIKIKFVGLFDTVEAFGVPFEELRWVIDYLLWPISFQNHRIWSRVENVRHALALDDERKTFHPLRVQPESKDDDPEKIKEVWFAGMHSDVGGGYPDDALAFTPLKWMLDEIRAISPELRFKTDALKDYEETASHFAELHDSRAGFSFMYRYDPRNPAAEKGRAQETQAPTVVHYSVIERMVFGWDNYAPVLLPKDARVLLPSGAVVHLQSPVGKLPEELEGQKEDPHTSMGRALLALRQLDSPEGEDQVIAKVARRGLNYYFLGGAIAVFLILPSIADDVATYLASFSHSIPKDAQPFTAIAASFEFWNKFWSGVNSALGFVAGAITPHVPDSLKPYLTVTREHPGIAFPLLILIYALYRLSDSLNHEIHARARAVWLRKDRRWFETRGKSAQKKETGRKVTIERREFPWAETIWRYLTGGYRIGRLVARSLWASALVAVIFFVGGRLVFAFASGWGGVVCQASKRPISVGDSLEPAKTLFRTDNMCWASGLLVKKGVPYVLTMEIVDGWSDGGQPSSVLGFESSDLKHFSLKPGVRWAFNNWLQPIAHVGEYGDYEEPVDPRGEATERALHWQFTPEADGELFLFANDVMPLASPVVDFYADNRGTARVTLQKKGMRLDNASGDARAAPSAIKIKEP